MPQKAESSSTSENKGADDCTGWWHDAAAAGAPTEVSEEQRGADWAHMATCVLLEDSGHSRVKNMAVRHLVG